jgi:multiple sugar transport system permease protein
LAKSELAKKTTARQRQRVGLLLILPAVALVAVFTIYPFGYAVYTSLVKDTIYYPQTVGQWNGLGNYDAVVTSDYFASAITNTMIFAIASTTLTMLTALGVTELLNNKFRGAGLARFLIFIPWAIPSVTAGLIWRQMFQDSGWISKILGLLGIIHQPVYFLAQGQSVLVLLTVIAQLWQQLPFCVLLLTAVYQLIPREVIDSASVDGAGSFKLYRAVTFPYLKTAVAILVVYELIISFNTYDLVYTFAGGAWGLISFYAFAESFNFGNLGNGAALSIIMGLVALAFVGMILYFLPPEKMYRYSFLSEE